MPNHLPRGVRQSTAARRAGRQPYRKRRRESGRNEGNGSRRGRRHDGRSTGGFPDDKDINRGSLDSDDVVIPTQYASEDILDWPLVTSADHIVEVGRLLAAKALQRFCQRPKDFRYL